MKSRIDLREEFYRMFTKVNYGSNDNRWWRLPKTTDEPELASPDRVWDWIEENILNNLDKGK